MSGVANRYKLRRETKYLTYWGLRNILENCKKAEQRIKKYIENIGKKKKKTIVFNKWFQEN